MVIIVYGSGLSPEYGSRVLVTLGFLNRVWFAYPSVILSIVSLTVANGMRPGLMPWVGGGKDGRASPGLHVAVRQEESHRDGYIP